MAPPPPDANVKSLHIADLDPLWDETWLNHVFSSIPQFTNAKIIRDKNTGFSMCYGFVEFSDQDSCQRVLESWNGQVIPGTMGKIFKLNWASQGGAAGGGGGPGDDFSLFVGDLSPDVTDHMLMDTFVIRGFNRLKCAKVVTDPLTNQAKGYGFVRFYDAADRDRALQQMQGVFCGVKPIRLALATPKKGAGATGTGTTTGGAAPAGNLPPWANSGGSSSSNTSSGASSAAAAAAYSGAAAMDPTAYMAAMYSSYGGYYDPAYYQNYAAYSMMPTDPTNTIVHVTNMDPAVTDQEIRALFAYYGNVLELKVTSARSTAFVQYSTAAEARSAIMSLNGWQLGNNIITCAWATNTTTNGKTTTKASKPSTPTVTGSSWYGYTYDQESSTTSTSANASTSHTNSASLPSNTTPTANGTSSTGNASISAPSEPSDDVSKPLDFAAENARFIRTSNMVVMDSVGRMLRLRQAMPEPGDGPA
eukprot:TRINITY_DN7893_c0_g1::TRINITY_DN7893_c0_g1_i1::g.23740::m.23740 TRINITY_DN7893_c0_g1::TRINITY_DN7893_c0_g1_i1::g.23740  ORF type:complete len:513 (+),score=77.86,sp/Q9LEB3/RBP47_NICPL/35.29/2e-54,RRM_1/PF00076.17/2.4e-11,RRM_1/PF00076.17/7.5e-12,RRM_1/PF00076.17/1.6e-10,RRM_6/PF14259.1/7.5e-05,RRM_6/PF14259.1/0.00014,RRM_6/PF14259.1/4.7e-09,RRM_5/PF13893.1/3.5e+03,RRM_5/PF13893.1/0.13,RRM_5/PF13893.1/0.015,RRM_5/PF13893.1/2.3e-07,RRM_3/PF08777.6/2e+03,RRM_3/PF08777.6/0.2,Nup35_RRM_2/PF14605.1/8.